MIPDLYAPRREPHSLLTILASFLGGSNPRTLLIMPVYSSGSRPAWSSDGRCPRDEAAQELEEAAAPSRADIELVTVELDQSRRGGRWSCWDQSADLSTLGNRRKFLIRTRITGRPRTLRVLLGPGRTGLELIGRHVQLSRVVESIVDLPRKRRVSELELVEVKPSGRPVIKSSRRFELAVSCLLPRRVVETIIVYPRDGRASRFE